MPIELMGIQTGHSADGTAVWGKTIKITGPWTKEILLLETNY